MQRRAVLLAVCVASTLSGCSERARAPAPSDPTSHHGTAPTAAACADVQLEPGRPTPRDPFVTHVSWLDNQTLLVAIDGRAFERREPDGRIARHLDVAESSRGYVVVDVLHHRVARAYRGLAPAQAVPRAGSPREQLVVDAGWVSTLGMSERVGVLDVDRGCARMAPWIAGAVVLPDPTRDVFYVARRRDPSSGYVTLERWPATRLAAAASESIAPLQSIVLAPRQLVGIDYAGDHLRTFDPVTLAETARLELGVVARSWPRRNGGVAEIEYQTRCTPIDRRAMALRCHEGPVRTGVLTIALDPPAIGARRDGVEIPEDKFPAQSVSPNGDATAVVDGATISIIARDGSKLWSLTVP